MSNENNTNLKIHKCFWRIVFVSNHGFPKTTVFSNFYYAKIHEIVLSFSLTCLYCTLANLASHWEFQKNSEVIVRILNR